MPTSSLLKFSNRRTEPSVPRASEFTKVVRPNTTVGRRFVGPAYGDSASSFRHVEPLSSLRKICASGALNPGTAHVTVMLAMKTLLRSFVVKLVPALHSVGPSPPLLVRR